MFRVVQKATKISQYIISKVVNRDDAVVDATLGNGKDTAFLSTLVPDGKVFAFEIQKEAVEKYKRYIDNNGLKNIILINDGHENMDKYIKEEVKAIIFNLGYLPGGDESITTHPDTTVEALKRGLQILMPGGVIAIVVYTGHDGGKEEKKAVMDCLKMLDARMYSVMEISYINKNEDAPSILVIEKNSSYHGHK